MMLWDSHLQLVSLSGSHWSLNYDRRFATLPISFKGSCLSPRVWSSSVRDQSKVNWCLHSGALVVFTLYYAEPEHLRLFWPRSARSIASFKRSRCFIIGETAAASGVVKTGSAEEEWICSQYERKPYYYSQNVKCTTYIMSSRSLAWRWILIKYKSLLKTLFLLVVCCRSLQLHRAHCLSPACLNI